MPAPPVSGEVSVEKIVDWIVLAEQSGWDGFSFWDHMTFYPDNAEIFDPWILRGAVAARTKRIKIVANITPLPRRRAWKVARETATLDRLSNGRLIFGVGIGNPPEDFSLFGEESDPKVRAERLDESLEIITGLWTGKPFSFEGRHHSIREVTFLPTPVQTPRIPIWVGGMWPAKAPMRRAAKWDGVCPSRMWPDVLTPVDLHELLEYIESFRGDLRNFDVSVGGQTNGGNKRKDEDTLAPWIGAGVTWWFEEINAWRAKANELEARIRRGPPEF
jgi:alkanesulfonate monooxygenase SsuD/methylene tetrahydromethanopterin reductase-like flavin-dependent oxidoreductase (luciferase family)